MADEIIKEIHNDNKKKKENIAKEKFNIISKIKCGFDNKKIFQLSKAAFRRVTIKAPIRSMVAKLRLKGYIHPIKKKAFRNGRLCSFSNLEIIEHFNIVILK